MRKRNTLFFIFLFSAFLVLSQKMDSIFVDSINVKVSMLRYEGKFVEAYDLINKLQTEIQNEEYNEGFYALTYYTKSRIEIELGKYNDAYDNAKSAFDIYLKNGDSIGIAKVYNLFGVGYYYKNQLDSTLIYYQKSYNLKKNHNFKDSEMAVSAYNLAMVYEDTGFFDQAMELYFEAKNYLIKDKEFSSFLPDVYIGIAHIYKYKKDYVQAEKFADKAMDIGLKTYGEFNPNMTFVYTSYANILESKKKYKESIKLLKKSLKIRENVYGEKHRWTCESYSDLGQVYVLDKQFEKAELCYRKAIKIGANKESKIYLADAKANLAFMYSDRFIKNNEVDKLLKETLIIFKNIYGEHNDIITNIYYYLAKNAKTRNDKNAFLSNVKEAYRAAKYDKFDSNKTVAPFQVLDVLVLEGDWYSQQYLHTNSIKWLLKKFDLLDQQIKLINLIQKNYSTEIAKISFANNYRTIFEKGLDVCWRLYHKSKDHKYLAKAFELSETNRNTVLLEGLQNLKYKLNSNVPKALLDTERQFQEKLAKVKMDLYFVKNSNNPNKEELSFLLNERIILSDRLDSLQTFFNEEFPRYSDFKHREKPVELLEVQNELDEDTQLITYFLGDDNLYSFIITKNEITFLKGDIAKRIVRKIQLLKTDLIAQKDIENTSKELYLYLLSQQIKIGKSNLVIIPDDVLNYIPFEILINENDESLIHNFKISYAGSIRLFIELNNDFFNYDLPNYWIGFSPAYASGNNLLTNVNEISEIANIIDGEVFSEDDSSKINFFNNSKTNSILHLAMHAEINNDNPLYNKLIFSDGDLTSSEIYVSDIRANLAVLSACNTGFGRLEKGEGIMSMARAFNYSGVPSVLMSLWKVPDKETKKIMIAFYKHLKNGESKSEALRNAKIDYISSINDESLKHPYFWAGFVLNGNTVKLEPPKKRSYYLLGGILIFGLVVIGIKFMGK